MGTIRNDLRLAYCMGYEDALANRDVNVDKALILMPDLDAYVQEILTENDELRELVRDMMQAWWACDTEKCPRHDERCEKGRYCAFDECVRKLGVEVSE